MKVLVVGCVVTEEKKYQVDCNKCNSILEVVKSDGRVHNGRYNETYLEVTCPVCGNAVYLDLQGGKNESTH